MNATQDDPQTKVSNRTTYVKIAWQCNRSTPKEEGRTAAVQNESPVRVRLLGARLPGGTSVTLRFDNLLSSKTGPSGTQNLLWDGQNVATASGPASTATPPSASAQFLGTDAATIGNWIGGRTGSRS